MGEERQIEHCEKMRQKGCPNVFLRLSTIKDILLIAKKWDISYEKTISILQDIEAIKNFYNNVNGHQILDEEMDRLYKLKNSDNIKTILTEEELMDCLENDNNSWEFSEKFRNSI